MIGVLRVVTQSVNPVYTPGIFTHPEPAARTARTINGVVIMLSDS